MPKQEKSLMIKWLSPEIMVFPKGSSYKLSPNFSAKEFDCPCNKCTHTIIHKELPLKLQSFRTELDSSVKVTNGFRCSNYQQDLKDRGFETSNGPSTHGIGAASDLWTGKHTGKELETIAIRAGFKAIGVGATFIHVDLRIDKEKRRWSYVKRKT